jgi:hypothetical protein
MAVVKQVVPAQPSNSLLLDFLQWSWHLRNVRTLHRLTLRCIRKLRNHLLRERNSYRKRHVLELNMRVVDFLIMCATVHRYRVKRCRQKQIWQAFLSQAHGVVIYKF